MNEKSVPRHQLSACLATLPLCDTLMPRCSAKNAVLTSEGAANQ
jgi:hypothetical protein